MLKKFWPYLVSIFTFAFSFVKNGVRPAVAVVSILRKEVEDSSYDLIAALNERFGDDKEGLSVFAGAIRKIFFTKEKDPVKIIGAFVENLREHSARMRKLLYLGIAVEYAKELYQEHKLKDYQVDTLVQLWYAAEKEQLPITRKFA